MRASASGTAQCACTSTVLTRLPPTTTSRRRGCAWTPPLGPTALVRLHPTKTRPAALRNSRRVVMAFSSSRRSWVSLDHLCGLQQDRLGNREPERSSRLQVDNEIKFRGLLHRQISWFGSLEDLVHVGRRTPIRVDEIRP